MDRNWWKSVLGIFIFNIVVVMKVLIVEDEIVVYENLMDIFIEIIFDIWIMVNMESVI